MKKPDFQEEKKSLADYWQRSMIVTDKKLIKAFMDVPREFFVDDNYTSLAYRDEPLPIGHGQTISQPTTIMIMTQQLGVKLGQKILEIGTGSGYQAALLGKIVGSKGKIITTEIIPELAVRARENLVNADIKNVIVVQSDGSMGYSEQAPYDGIIVTAACPAIPKPLIEQLKEGGIIIAPVGNLDYGQEMLKVIKGRKNIITHRLGSFTFVPLKGKHGFK